MEITIPWVDGIVFGLVFVGFGFTVWYYWVPNGTRIFLKECCQRFMTLFTGWNALLVTMYLGCCVMSVILLP
ncbi:hypothetical protein KAR91_67770 [Candidatus Pacearchaeota archaeon]|nr:hypothetical protein [Candidatus Pacearchaeota archaeon]